MLYINWAAFFLAIAAILASVEILKLVGGRGRIITTASFVYIAVVRGMVLSNVYWGTHFPTAQLAVGFFILMDIGLVMLVVELRHTLRPRHKDKA